MNTVSIENSKAEIFNALVEALAKIEATKVEATTQPIVRDKTIFIAAANKQRAEFAAARTEFVVAWCKANAQTSCPSNVVADWASARK